MPHADPMSDPEVIHWTDTCVFFWRPPSPFGQWTRARFELEQHTYSCAEQYMMAEKARLFGDETVRKQILATDEPREHKRLGRTVSGFSVEVWEAHREDIVFRANVAKFSQNQDLLAVLTKTGSRMLVEASPYDRIWGIGLRSTDPGADDPARWRGLNLLGKVLMRVRDHLLSPTRS